MAKILYSVTGEGFGHSSRSKEIISYLIKKGHKVKVISYGKGYKVLKKHYEVKKIFGLHFAYKNNEIRYLETVLKNISEFPKAKKSVDKVIKTFEEFRPEIVFTDFEPISCIAAHIKNIPLISIDNQHRLTRTQIDYPKKYQKEAAIAMAVTNLLVFKANAYLIINFHKNKIKKRKTYLFPPILRKEVLKLSPKINDYILVYVTSKYKPIIGILKKINKKFIVYGFNKERKEKNILYKKTNEKGFLKDLANCQGVIANAGFTLISEALYLHKPYLAIPVKGQFEQVINAYYLEKLGYGKYLDKPDKERLELFLNNINKYRKNLRRYKKEDNRKIFKKINQLIKEYSH